MTKQLLYVVKIVLIFAACLVGIESYAQTHSISGKVIDAAGVPVVGASVIVVGNNRISAVTDLDGNFSLVVPAGANLNVSFIGYKSQVVAVGNQRTFEITLIEDTEVLEEVVVVGYGVQRKSDVTGSVSSVKAEDLNNRSTSDAASALQGKAAGVQILNLSAAPGAGSQIRVRGYSSNSSEGLGPLLIVDGLQVDNIQYLDPQMIESMEVLKDAASAAIYGAQAGNGVVLITTKTGNKEMGAGQVFYNFQNVWNSLGKAAEVMNAGQYIDYKKAQGVLTQQRLDDLGYSGTDTNWSKEVFTTSLTKRHTVGFMGGNNRGQFYAALNYVNDDGIVRGDKDVYERLSAQLNADYKIKDWLTVGTNTSIEKWKTRSVSQHNEFGSVMMGTLTQDPLTPVYYPTYNDLTQDMKNHYDAGERILGDENGFYAVSKIVETDSGHPFIQRDKEDVENQGINIRGSLYANLSPIKGLTITSRFGYRIFQSYYSRYAAPYYANSMAFKTNYDIQANANQGFYYQWENFANYTFNVMKNTFTLMGGMSFIQNNTFAVNGTGTGPDPLQGYAPNFRYLSYLNNNSDTSKTVTGAPGITANLSYFGRIHWNYADKYNIQVNFRADAYDSSKLPIDARWGYFPSVSAGWVLTNESFMQGVSKEALSFLKIRGSWGVNGNIAVLNNYPYATTISYNANWYQYNPGAPTVSYGSSPSGLANPNLKWETSVQWNLGLDARFLSNRLTLGLDYYEKYTKDLLVNVSPVAEVGVGSSTINAGEVENKGVELELEWKDTKGDFSYSINANAAYLHNEVTFLDPTISRIQGMAPVQSTELSTQFEVGYPIWYMRGYQYEGVDSATGKPILADLDGNGIIDAADQTMVGCGIPDLTYGLTIKLAWKGIDFTVFGTGTYGNEIFAVSYRGDRPLYNSLEYFHKNAWTESNKNASMPSAISVVSDAKFWGSSASVFDGSYFKIKQIQVGYTLPQNWTKKIFISSLRIYASLDDYFTFSKYPGMDPETASSGRANSLGFDKGSYPTRKKAVVGINIAF
ncbi:MAG: TonB-dependent receptor [Bacteroidales bacterium]|jgi:TonB-linked SusC/RagA family outer membrane protein|nr:TonB-dependent receptor [Bacteroidales bacterium]MDD3101164.1 TonB-dependent receptor [Bacteroidales bacterium]MDD3639923.1 TonB-dependent receptor [Bacteroidales bacterium]MDD4480723.1 TonB-dependent receptor [Bacteroidales bacterium]MDD5314346.1 TonB-dependent receptor [Bacteroidales bacterium]